MSIARQVGLAVMLALSASGCVWNSGSLAPKRQVLPKPATLNVDDFVAQHNANADKVQSLLARPSIRVQARFVGLSDFDGPTEGRLAMERPQNFKLVLEAFGQRKVADIGSNDQEFWYWVPNERDRSIYWCSYTDLDRTGVDVPFRPEWIVESMGLKTISSEEASHIKAKAGPDSGTSSLTLPPTQVGGETYHRTLVVNNSDRRIKQFRVLAADNRSVVLEATLSDYQDYELPDTQGPVETCFLADAIRLDWKRERIAFDVKMQDVRVNQFSKANSASLFVAPEMPGYTRRNLAELKRGSGRDSKTTVRRSTIPAPDPRRNGTLDDPSAGSDDRTLVPRLGQSRGGTPKRTSTGRATPAQPDADDDRSFPALPPLENVIGAPVASVPMAADARTAGILGSQGSPMSVER